MIPLDGTVALCNNCGEKIEDRSEPRASGPQYPLWFHLHSNSSQCDDGTFASPTSATDDDVNAGERHERAIMSPMSDEAGAALTERLQSGQFARRTVRDPKDSSR